MDHVSWNGVGGGRCPERISPRAPAMMSCGPRRDDSSPSPTLVSFVRGAACFHNPLVGSDIARTAPPSSRLTILAFAWSIPKSPRRRSPRYQRYGDTCLAFDVTPPRGSCAIDSLSRAGVRRATSNTLRSGREP